MDTALNIPTPAATVTATAPVLPRAITTKVQAVESADNSATLPADKPFIAQVVTARLSGSEFPENPAEIAPPERTLRPYDVPMLPYENGEAADTATVADTLAPTEDSTTKDT
ncbi:hypothetical protein QTO30_01220 [Yoonia sp. GPGPB17]|uniref:hypothetical protein n=1 Tax=Yoonia sp. GPGPB17 TaxID=3026147 RepID=UPI0030BAC876